MGSKGIQKDLPENTSEKTLKKTSKETCLNKGTGSAIKVKSIPNTAQRFQETLTEHHTTPPSVSIKRVFQTMVRTSKRHS